MSTPLSTRLRELVWSDGDEVALDAATCRQVLAHVEDVLPAQRDALVAVVQHGLTRDVWGRAVTDDVRDRLTAELERAGVDPGLARWAIRTWTDALGGELDAASGEGSAEPPSSSGTTVAEGGPPTRSDPDLAGWFRPAPEGEPPPPEHHYPEGPAPFVAADEPEVRPRTSRRFVPLAIIGLGVVVTGILAFAALNVGSGDDPPDDDASETTGDNTDGAAGPLALAICDGEEVDGGACGEDQAGEELIEPRALVCSAQADEPPTRSVELVLTRNGDVLREESVDFTAGAAEPPAVQVGLGGQPLPQGAYACRTEIDGDPVESEVTVDGPAEEFYGALACLSDELQGEGEARFCPVDAAKESSGTRPR